MTMRGHLPTAGVRTFPTWLYSNKTSLSLENLPEGWQCSKEMRSNFAEGLKALAQGVAVGADRPFKDLPIPPKMEQNTRVMVKREQTREGLVWVYAGSS